MNDFIVTFGGFIIASQVVITVLLINVSDSNSALFPYTFCVRTVMTYKEFFNQLIDE